MASEIMYVRRESAVSCALADGAAILDTAANRYYSLNAVGALIWDNLPSTASVLAKLLVERFGIDQSRALADVDGMLRELEREGLAAAGAQQAA